MDCLLGALAGHAGAHLALALREGILRIESGGFGFVIRFLYLLDRLLDLGVDVLGLFLGFFVALFCPGIVFESLLRLELAVSLLQVVAPGGFHFFFRFAEGVNGSVRGCSHSAFVEEPTPNGPVLAFFHQGRGFFDRNELVHRKIKPPCPSVCKVGIGVQRNHFCWIRILPAGDIWKLTSISS